MIFLRKNRRPLPRSIAPVAAIDDDRKADDFAAMLQAIETGDLAAYTRLTERFAPRLRTFLRRLVRDPALADELALETLAAAYQRAGGCRDAAAFSVWIFRIARNRALDHLRAAQSRERAHDESRRRTPDIDVRTPLRLLEHRELEMRLERALADLDEPFRTVFLLREREGLSYEAIAEITEVPAKTVSTRLVRARLFLRARLLGYLRGDAHLNEQTDGIPMGGDDELQ